MSNSIRLFWFTIAVVAASVCGFGALLSIFRSDGTGPIMLQIVFSALNILIAAGHYTILNNKLNGRVRLDE